MDCLHAAEILSAVLDGQAVSPAPVAHAREHCSQCPECAALLATMHRVAAAPQTRAPEQLVAHILETVRAEAEAQADAEADARHAAATVGIVPPVTPVTPARPRSSASTPRWRPRFAPVASAAAVVILVSAVSTYALIRMTQPSSQAESLDSIEIASQDDGTAGERSGYGSDAAPESRMADTLAASNVTAPPYVSWRGTAWVRADGGLPPESEITSAGTASSDLGETDGPKDREVMSAASDADAIFVRASDGSVIRFQRVTRALAARTYALVSDTPIVAFGAWPALPSRFAPPTADDGSPTFVLQGFDDLGRQVFVPSGSEAAEGFAVAPGTPPDDPAAGNPGWTWWEPLD